MQCDCPMPHRLFFRRFILDDVPVLDQNSVLNADDVCSNPIYRRTETAKTFSSCIVTLVEQRIEGF